MIIQQYIIGTHLVRVLYVNSISKRRTFRDIHNRKGDQTSQEVPHNVFQSVSDYINNGIVLPNSAFIKKSIKNIEFKLLVYIKQKGFVENMKIQDCLSCTTAIITFPRCFIKTFLIKDWSLSSLVHTLCV